MKLKKLLSVVFILISIISCSEKIGKETKSISFNINSSLLGPIYKESQFSFQPPKNCTPISSDLFTQLQKNISENMHFSDFKVIPKEIFANQDSSFFCNFSKVIATKKTPNKVKIFYQSILEKYSNTKIDTASFKYNDFMFNQIIVSSHKNILIELIINSKNQEIFIIDYLIPNKIYPQKIRAIESSIGSIQNIKKEKK